MKYRLLLLVCIVIASVRCSAQRDYKYDAQKAFNSGQYENAEKLYNAAFIITGEDFKVQLTLCQECLLNQQAARQYEKAEMLRMHVCFFKR